MTRSVEIPEEAVEVAREAYRASACALSANGAMRAALEAAVPYLAPAAPFANRAGRAYINEQTRLTEEVLAAPAGDGGLREALGQAWDDGNATGLDGYVGPGRGAGEVDPEAERARERAIDKLAAHPAAPAPVVGVCEHPSDIFGPCTLLQGHELHGYLHLNAKGEKWSNAGEPAHTAHPAAPAVPQPAVIEVTEEMVEAAAEEVWPQGGSLDQHRLVRRGLEAAFQHLPFTDVPLSLNREAVKAAIRSVIFQEFGTFGGSVDRATAAVMALTAVPQPADREALRERITDVVQEAFYGSAAPGFAFERKESGKVADAVLAVLAGEQEQVEP